jgi:FAD-linked oxidoreductase
MAEWRNWSGSVLAQPSRIERPRTEAELSALIAQSARVRVVGTGHSFMPLCETDGLLLSLAEMEGELEVAPDRASIWAPAGWSIGRLTQAMWDQGLSLANQGDIDKQAIAGALATATHGTGRTLGSLATQALAYRLVLADGSLIECDREREPELFEAQRVSLGMLGVMSRVKLSVAPAYYLSETIAKRPLEAVLDSWDALAGGHRHAEFFVFPYADHAAVKILEPADPFDDFDRPDFDAGGFRTLCEIARTLPVMTPLLQRIATRSVGPSARTGPAHRIFPGERELRFEEMEYELPAANGPAAMRAAIAEVRRRRLPIIFPLEFRTVAADDIWLSPMHQRDCVSISFHQYARMPWREAFRIVEAVFREHGGRPHWAKRHTLVSDDVLALYPMAQRWGAVRKQFDPAGKFMNAHLRELFAFSL